MTGTGPGLVLQATPFRLLCVGGGFTTCHAVVSPLGLLFTYTIVPSLPTATQFDVVKSPVSVQEIALRFADVLDT